MGSRIKILANKALLYTRIEAGLSRKEMAIITGITPAGYAQIEQGVTGAAEITAKKICEALGKSFHYLFLIKQRR